MIRSVRRGLAPLAIILLGLLAGPLPLVAADNPTRVIVVRHAEKADESRDPPLSDQGRQRAEALAEVLVGARLDSAYASQYRRTQATAAPAADAAGIDVWIEPIEGEIETWAGRFAAALVERHPGETVLVVGHSNTVPPLVAALCDCQVNPLTDTQYDRLFIVRRNASGEARLIRARYGRH